MNVNLYMFGSECSQHATLAYAQYGKCVLFNESLKALFPYRPGLSATCLGPRFCLQESCK